MKRILIADGFNDDALKRLKENPDLEMVVNKKTSPEELQGFLGEIDGLIVRSATKVTSEVLQKAAPRLKTIVRAGEGVDNIDLNEAKKQGVAVMNTPGANSQAVAEMTIGAMFSMARNLHLGYQSMKEGKWEKSKLLGFELENKTLGILGIGKIGRLVGLKALALGMKVIAFDPFVDHVPNSKINLTSTLESLLQNSDFLSVHVPFSPETKHIINRENIKLLRPESYLINHARGGVVEEAAMAQALKNDQLAGLALDVYTKEPPPEDDSDIQAIIKDPRVLCTPHLGASSKEAKKRVSLMAADQISDFFKSGKIENSVLKDA